MDTRPDTRDYFVINTRRGSDFGLFSIFWFDFDTIVVLFWLALFEVAESLLHTFFNQDLQILWLERRLASFVGAVVARVGLFLSFQELLAFAGVMRRRFVVTAPFARLWFLVRRTLAIRRTFPLLGAFTFGTCRSLGFVGKIYAFRLKFLQAHSEFDEFFHRG